MSDGRGTYWGYIVLLVIVYFLLTIGLGLERWVPDLLTVALLLAARRLPGAGAAALGLALGLVRDAVAVDGFGADAIVLTVLGYVGARSRDLFEGDSLLFMAVYLFLGKWLHDIGYGLLAQGGPRGGLVDWLVLDRPMAAALAAAGGLVTLVLHRMATRAR